MTKLVRVTQKVYEKLHALAGKLQARKKGPVSLSEAVEFLFSPRRTSQKIVSGPKKRAAKPKHAPVVQVHRREIW